MKKYILLIFLLHLSMSLSIVAADKGAAASSSSSSSSFSSSGSDSESSRGSGLEGYREIGPDDGHADLAASYGLSLRAAGAVGSASNRGLVGTVLRVCAGASGSLYMDQAGIGDREERNRTLAVARQAGQILHQAKALPPEIARQYRDRETAVSDTAQFLITALADIEDISVVQAKQILQATEQFLADHRKRLLSRPFERILQDTLETARSKITTPQGDDKDGTSSDSD